MCPQAQRWEGHPPAHVPHLTPQSAASTSRAGQCWAGCLPGVPSPSAEPIPTAQELFKEVGPAGQMWPSSLPVCVLAQIFIHFLRKATECSQPGGG